MQNKTYYHDGHWPPFDLNTSIKMKRSHQTMSLANLQSIFEESIFLQFVYPMSFILSV